VMAAKYGRRMGCHDQYRFLRDRVDRSFSMHENFEGIPEGLLR
jgi:hypothetical protein